MSNQGASQRIGLESFVGTDAFEKGMMTYISGLGKMTQTTDAAAAVLSGSMGNAASDVGDELSGLSGVGGQVMDTFSKINFWALTLATALGHVLVNALTAVIGKLKELISSGIMAAARVQEMDFVLQVLGQRLGYTRGELDQLVQSVVEYGIRTDVAQNLIQQFIRYNLDLASAVDLARVAQDTAVISMTDSSEMLDRLIWGIQRYDTQILRTGGINITTADAFRKYAEEIGKTADQLTEAEKQQAFLNAVLEEGARNAGIYEAAMEAPGKQLRSFARNVWELSRVMAEPFLPAFAAVVKTLRETAKTFQEAFEEGGRLHNIMIVLGAVASIVADAFRNFVTNGADAVIDFFARLPELIENAIIFIVELAEKAYNWGYDLVSSYAEGMADAVNAVVDVLMWLANVITGWLLPGSPPKILPDIDKWGKATMEEWLFGWTMADFSIFNEIASTLTRYLQSISNQIGETGLIPRILGTREAIMEAIQLVNEVGEVTQEAVNIVMDAFGESNPIIEEYVRLMLEVEEAIQDVNTAAEDLDLLKSLSVDTLGDADDIISNLSGDLQGLAQDYVDALGALAEANQDVAESQEYLNEVTTFYDEILGALKQQLAGFVLEDNADRIEEINKAIASGLLTQDEIEKLEKEKLQLQIQSIEVLKKAETDAAKEKVDAAKDTQDAAAQAAQEAQDAALTVAQANLDAAKAQQQAIAEQLASYQQIIALQTEQNQLIQQQIALLERLAAQAAAAGGGGGAGFGGGGAGFGFDVEGAGEGIFDTLTDKITEKIEDMKKRIRDKFDEIVAVIKDKLREFAQPLYPLINALFGTNIGTDKASGDLGGGGSSGGLFGAVKAILDPIVQWLQIKIPIAIKTFTNWWNTVLIPALSDGWMWFKDNILPVLEDIRVWLADNLPPAIEALSKFWSEQLQPAIETFGNFLLEHGDEIIAFFVGFVGTLWLIVNVSTALLGVIGAVGVIIEWVAGLIIALTSPIGLVAIAIGLLAAAWVGNWGNMRTKLEEFWYGKVLPIFETIRDWFEAKFDAAITILGTAWDRITAMWQALVDFWNEVPGPLFDAIKTLLEVTMTYAIDVLSSAWETRLKPALVTVYEYIRDFFQPIFETIENIVGVLLVTALGNLSTAWENFKTFLNETIFPVLQTLMDAFLTPIKDLFKDVKTAVIELADWILTLADRISRLAIPSWAIRDSPSEIEQTLFGMIDGMEKLSTRSIPNLARQLKDLGHINVNNLSGGANGNTVTNIQNTKNVQVSVNPTYEQVQSPASVYYDVNAALIGAGL